MKAICIYVDRGEEYKATAKLICNMLNKAGHQAVVEELFDYLDIKWLDTYFSFIRKLINKFRINTLFGSSSWELDRLIKFANKHCTLAFQSNLEEEPADLFICIHPYTSHLITELRKNTRKDNLSVCYYETRFFSISKNTVNNDVDKFFISTDQGAEEATLIGQNESSIALSPILLPEAKDLVIDNVEGNHKVRILYDMKDDKVNLSKLIKKDINAEFLLFNINQDKIKKLKADASKCKHLKLTFLSKNIENKYNLFSKADIIIGPSDRKAMLVALYLKKAYFLTEKKKKNNDITDFIIENNLGLILPSNNDKQFEEINNYINRFDKSSFDVLNFNAHSFISQLEEIC